MCLPRIGEREPQICDRPPGEAGNASVAVYGLERVVVAVRQDDAQPVNQSVCSMWSRRPQTSYGDQASGAARA
jgi:hypothetical protein